MYILFTSWVWSSYWNMKEKLCFHLFLISFVNCWHLCAALCYENLAPISDTIVQHKMGKMKEKKSLHMHLKIRAIAECIFTYSMFGKDVHLIGIHVSSLVIAVYKKRCVTYMVESESSNFVPYEFSCHHGRFYWMLFLKFFPLSRISASGDTSAGNTPVGHFLILNHYCHASFLIKLRH
jgi:hypothetical protein